MSFVVVIPIKGLAAAKRRLRAGYSAAATVELALAFAVDTLTAAKHCPRVSRTIVVTSDVRVRSAALSLGARVADDPGGGLNAAARYGIEAAHAERQAHIGVLTGDLPALTAECLATALVAATTVDRALVPDFVGTGTTLITARSGVPLIPAFGQDSRHRHETLGHFALPIPEQSALRRDVDTPDDLAAAVALGVGFATRTALGLVAARRRDDPRSPINHR